MGMRYTPFLSWVAQRIQKNKNAIIVINGDTGSGKTYAAIRLCIDIAKQQGTHFTINDNMDFNFGELLKKMGLKQNQQAGTPFLFEEVGAVGGGGASREWQSKANRFFTSFMQTSRHRQQIFIMTCPFFSDLDIGTRKLCHFQMEMKGIDYRLNTSFAKPSVIQVNKRTGKVYYKYIRFTHNNLKHKFSTIQFKIPQQKDLDIYEELKTKYTSALNQRIIEENQPKEKKKLEKFWHECTNCAFTWDSVNKTPKYCPKCRRYGVIPKKNKDMMMKKDISPHLNLTSNATSKVVP